MPTERRTSARLGLAIPVRVQGFLGDGGSWEELSTTFDVSSGGACFPLSHPVGLGQVLLLVLALPKRLRRYDLSIASYRVYSLVRGVRHGTRQPRVGVMFFGEQPPRGFQQRPSGRYLLPTDSIEAIAPRGLKDGDLSVITLPAVDPPAADPERPAPLPSPATPPEFLPTTERRATPRADIFVNFTIQQLGVAGGVLQEELTVADNVGSGGARVMTTLPFHVGDVVLLREIGGTFTTRAEIRAITRVQPAVDRLHLRFIDQRAPDRLTR